MVYGKYVNKKGKVFGPYYYRSYRDGDSVKKIYIGGEKEFKEYLRNKKKVEQPLRPLQPLNRTKAVRAFYLLLLLFLIGGIIFFVSDDFKIKISEDSYYNIFNSKNLNSITGYVSKDISDENIYETFEGLEIKEPPKLGDSFLSANKNNRMDFDMEGGLRLYFDLLNYSDYVEETGKKLVDNNIFSDGELFIRENEKLNKNDENFIYDEVESDVSVIDVKKIEDFFDELNKEELEEISSSAVVEAEEFSIEVDKNEASDLNVDYKWGYKVKLNDLNFISKIDITSDNEISIIDDSSLKIGNNILSFKDLANEGYKVRINRPNLDLGLKEKVVEKNKSKEKNITKENEDFLIKNESVENELVNKTENNYNFSNKSEIKDIELIEIPGESGISGRVVKEIEKNKSENINDNEKNENSSEENKKSEENKSKIVEEPKLLEVEPVEKQEKQEENFSAIEDKEEIVKEPELVEIIPVEDIEKKNVENNIEKDNEDAEENIVKGAQIVEGGSFISGNVIRGITGFAINNIEVQDLKYKNSVSIYVERDFKGTDYKIGDILYLDPTLVSINISDVASNINTINITRENNFTHLTISNVIPYNSLVLYMPFDLNHTSLNMTYDFSALNNDGNISELPAFMRNASCLYGGCYKFDGVNDGINVSDNESLQFIDNLTIMAWVFPLLINTGSATEPIVDKYSNNGAFIINGYKLALQDSDEVTFMFGSGLNIESLNTTTSPISVNKWNHVAVTGNFFIGSSNVSVYVNGVIIKSFIPVMNSLSTNTEVLEIGSGGDTIITEYFNGSIDEVMLFNVTLTNSEITNIYNNQSPRFNSNGIQEFNNQTQLNISIGYDKIRVVGDVLNYSNSSVNLSVGFYNGSWRVSDTQVFSGNNIFYINNKSTNLTLNFTFYAGNKSAVSSLGGHNFYSPILSSDVRSLYVHVERDYNISGIVFNDTNYNGAKGAAENGLGNVTIRAWNDSNGDGSVGSTETLVSFTTTNSSGGYNMSFNNSVGEVIIQISDLDNKLLYYRNTTRKDINFTGENLTVNFGFYYNTSATGNGSVKRNTKISDGLAGFNPDSLNNSDLFGSSVTSIGDLDGDGIIDLAVGAYSDENIASNLDHGALYILFLNDTNGTVKRNTKIAHGLAGLSSSGGILNGFFGYSVAPIGDLDGDGFVDLAVGAIGESNQVGNSSEGALYILFLNDTNGTVKRNTRISDGLAGFNPTLLDQNDNFGIGITSIGDLDGDGIIDLAVGAYSDENTEAGEGAIYILFLNDTNGTVKRNTKISDGLAGFNPDGLNGSDGFGRSIFNVGDLDGDGIIDLEKFAKLTEK